MFQNDPPFSKLSHVHHDWRSVLHKRYSHVLTMCLYFVAYACQLQHIPDQLVRACMGCELQFHMQLHKFTCFDGFSLVGYLQPSSHHQAIPLSYKAMRIASLYPYIINVSIVCPFFLVYYYDHNLGMWLQHSW